MLSVIIPSRNDQFLQRTIDDILVGVEGEIEIIVALDGYWPNPQLQNDPRVKLLHHGTIHDNVGMRGGINAAAAMSQGEYLMKLDEHCAVDKGFDTKLKADCEDNWVVIPRRYRLDAENWQLFEDGRPPIDYMYIDYPFAKGLDAPLDLHGSIWKQRTEDNKDILIDDTMSWQGSCWFLKKSYWDKLFPDGLDVEHYGDFAQEAQEIGNSVWLSGGRLVVNKKTWYAHYHKTRENSSLGFSNAQHRRHQQSKDKGRRYSVDFWLNNRWDKRVHDFEWLIEKFWPVPTWPDNWKKTLEEYNNGRLATEAAK